MGKLILFELNEVPWRIFDHYRSIRPNSWIARHFPAFKKYETISENQGHLSPWNTWPTVHRGVANGSHFISDFNQDLTEVDREFPPIWHLLTAAGVNVGVFGSLHSYPMPSDLANYSFYVPDVFAAGSECFPTDVETFQDVNLKLSRESARNVDRSIPFGQIARLLRDARGLGFKASTVADVGSHLFQERLAPWKATRRRSYQSVISFDVFYKLLTDKRPNLATFFTNHVASSMHRYWAALFPADYSTQKFDDEWLQTYGGEVSFAMDKADRMLASLAAFVDRDPEYSLLITSSMGQHAVECEPTETQLYIVDRDRFMSLMGVGSATEYQFLPSMLPQFNFSVADDRAAQFDSRLASLAINGVPVVYRKLPSNGFSIDLGHENLKETVVTIGGRTISLADAGMENVVIEDKSSSTAYHIPEGHLFVYHPSFERSDAVQTQLPTTEIAPMILANFAVARPEYMPATSASFKI